MSEVKAILKDTPLSVKLEDGDLVIRIGIDRLAFCAERQDDWNPYDETRGDFVQKWYVSDKQEFAKDVCGQMTAEEEDGSTSLSDLLDKMSTAAMEDGSLGVEERPSGTPCAYAQDIAQRNNAQSAPN